MNYLFSKPWKRTLFFILLVTSLCSLLLSLYFWNIIGYVNVIRFLVFFVIFVISSLSLCIFCLKNAINHLKQNELIREESVNKKKEQVIKKKVVNEDLINKITSNIDAAPKKKIDYSKMTVIELKSICKDNHIKGYSKLNKKELIIIIKENVK